MKTVILDHVKIERILKRIAFQIIEHCYDDDEVTIIGIEPRGIWVARQIEKELKKLSAFKIDLATIDADVDIDVGKMEPHIKGRNVVLIDDVVNSGHTMMIAASSIVGLKPKSLLTACLVDRKHRRFPIKSNFTGLSLATTLQEHIRLVIKPKPTIYLE